MANRIPIQSLFDILSKKCPQDVNWYDMYLLNKKEIKHISRVFLKTIKDFSQTIKIKNKVFEKTEIPQIIYKKNIKYIKLPNQQNELLFDNSNYKIFEKYFNDLIKNDEIDKLHYILENKIFSIDYFCPEKQYRNVDGHIFKFIQFYIIEYLYYSLILKDNNIKIQIDKNANFQHATNSNGYVLKDVYKHDFKFPHEKVNEHMTRKLNYILESNNLNLDITTDIVQKKILDNSFDVNFLKEYTKYCFRKIYYTYYLINKFGNQKNLDEWIYYNIKITQIKYLKFKSG
jgi:hypothetical protein